MFDNIGEKIKTLAKVVCWVGIIASVVMGFVAVASTNDETAGFFSLVLIAGLGSLGSWVGSFVLYGFGELVSNSAIVAETLKVSKKTDSGKKSTVDTETEEVPVSNEIIMRDLLDAGAITRNEYDAIIGKERKN